MFIAFDGIDGSGKSTQLSMLTQYFLKKQIDHFIYDMGNFATMSKYLTNLKHSKTKCSAQLRELLYYFEGRLLSDFYTDMCQNTNKFIVCDRWLLTYFAYGQYNGVPFSDIEYFTRKIVRPDIYFFMNISPEEALNRIVKYRKIDNAEIGYRNTLSNNEYDNEAKFLKAQAIIRNNYLSSIQHASFPVIQIDASQDVDSIHRTIIGQIERKIIL